MTNETDDYADELLDGFDAHDLVVPASNTDGYPTLTCDNADCEGVALREGNLATTLVTRDDQDAWHVEYTCCKDCSVRDLYERLDNDNITAVVEGELQPTPDPDEAGAWATDNLALSGAVVWDIHTPTCNEP